jgi:hypothetical protein
MRLRITIIITVVLQFCLASDGVLALPFNTQEHGMINPFGLTIGGSGLTTQQRIALSKELGVVYFRPWAVFLDRWNGRHEDTEAFQSAGFKIIMTVRNNGSGAPSYVPTTPPTDTAAYKKTLGEVLNKYHPELLVVENEENSTLFYTGTPEEYAVELQAALETAHSRGIKCTNGGMVSGLVALLVWNNYLELGDTTRAWDFAKQAFSPAELQVLRSPTRAQKQQIDAQIDNGKRLLNVYKTSGIDYVNFHWYIADSAALEEAVSFLRSSTGLQPITNEMGQHDLSPNTVTQLMGKTVELKLQYTVWYSIDTYRTNGDTTAYALQNADGTLRENGVAFKNFVQSLTSVGSGPTNAPNNFCLEQNYPNPFNPSTVISFEIPSRNFVELKIYDLLGRTIASFVNEEKEAGKYSIRFNGNSLASGIYFYKLTAGNYSQTKKLILMK